MTNVIISGFPRAGKTSVGRQLAESLNRRFIDTDRQIEAAYELATGVFLPCREIHAREGERAFRYLERAVVEDLQEIQGAVVALGGGVLLSKENGELLQTIGTILYLEVAKPLLLERLLQEKIFSLLDPKKPQTSFDELYNRRLPYYRAYVDHVIKADGTVSEIVQEICEKLKEESDGQ